jgi:methyltransferase
MDHFLIWASLVAGYFFAFLAESRRHQKNYQFLRSRGAEETAATLMKAYYAAPWLILALAAVERYFRGSTSILVDLRPLALTLIIFGFLLRIWVIHSLGWLWTRRCLHRRGFPKINSGPFRWISHPEYLARIIEISGFCLFLNSYATLGLGLISGSLAVILITRRELAQMASFEWGTTEMPRT